MEASVNTSCVDDEGRTVGTGEGVVVRNDIVGRAKNRGVAVTVGMALCVSAKAVLTVDMAVSMISAGLSVGVDRSLLQDASIPVARKKAITVLPARFTAHSPLMFCRETPNGGRDEGTPFCRDPLQARKKAKKRADSQPSAAHCVSPRSTD